MKTDIKGKGLLDAALGFAERGWHVFPLTPGTSIPVGNCSDCRTSTGPDGVRTAQHKADTCPCIPQGKPCHGVRAATTNARRIARWWSDRPYGIGIACGISGLVVMDCDAHGGTAPTHRELILPHRPDAVIMAPRNGIDVFTERIGLIIRAPLNRLQDMVSTTWKFLGDWPTRTDGAVGDAAVFKRCATTEHGE